MAKEALLQTVSNAMIESIKNATTVSRVQITGNFKDVKDIIFTADDWKRGTQLIDDAENTLVGRLEKIVMY
jgi:PBP1b-binding outer membrane lipoprotein LpoB